MYLGDELVLVLLLLLLGLFVLVRDVPLEVGFLDLTSFFLLFLLFPGEGVSTRSSSSSAFAAETG